MAGKKLSRSARQEMLTALRDRYGRASKIEKGAILNEFVALSGYNRKYATRILGNAASPDPAPPAKSTYRIYDEAVAEGTFDHPLGSGRSDLGQTIASDIAEPDRVAGKAWPPTAQSRCTQQAANNQPGVDRSDAQTSPQDRRQPQAKSPPPQSPPQDGPDPNLRRLAWPQARLPGDRPGGPLRRQLGRILHPDPASYRCCLGLGGSNTASCPGADACDRGA